MYREGYPKLVWDYEIYGYKRNPTGEAASLARVLRPDVPPIDLGTDFEQYSTKSIEGWERTVPAT